MTFPNLSAFLATHAGACRVAIVGGSTADRIPEVEALLRSVLGPLAHEELVIVTGGTEDGVPGAATRIAHACGLPIIGVLPERGVKHASSVFTDADPARVCRIVVSPSDGQSRFGSLPNARSYVSQRAPNIRGAYVVTIHDITLAQVYERGHGAHCRVLANGIRLLLIAAGYQRTAPKVRSTDSWDHRCSPERRRVFPRDAQKYS